jgi:S-adenosylmethionine:tRNA ribosyltransferase-isomerase
MPRCAPKSPPPGTRIRLADAFDVTVGERFGEFYAAFPADVFELLEQHGSLPLPPYIDHEADAYDETRYQTVYARNPVPPRPPPACTSTKPCWRGWPRAASSRPS